MIVCAIVCARATADAAIDATDDPRALTELGWQAFRAHDLVKAEAATRKAIARAKDARIAGAALYNLGRILEEQGKKQDAVNAYRQSLEKRSNRIVMARLLSLDPSADPIRPAPLIGPFQSLDQYCHTLKDVTCSSETERPQSSGANKPQRVVAPFRAVKLFVTGPADTPVGTQYNLAIQTDVGWFIDREVAPHEDDDVDLRGRIDALDVGPQREGGAPLVRAIVVEIHCDDEIEPGEEWRDEHGHKHVASGYSHHLFSTAERSLIVCGVGSAGKPSCTPKITIGESTPKRKGEAEHAQWSKKVNVSFTARGLELSPEGNQSAPEIHALTFP